MIWADLSSQKFGKLNSGHRTGKGQFLFKFQRKAMPKNAQTTAQLHSSHMLAKLCLKFSKPGFNSTWTVLLNGEFPDVQAGFGKARGARDQIANICWIIERAREFQKHLLMLYWLCQGLWLCGSWQTVENSERNGNTRPPDLPPEKSVCRSRSNN